MQHDSKPHACFIERYRDVVRDHGDRPALVVDGAVRFTHRALWQAAGALAARWSARGIGVETVVGLSHGRSAELVVGMLAAWRARAAWLCLDPALPPERARLMAERARVAHVMDVRRELDAVDSGTTTEAEARARAEDLAYVVFTSGSAGRPKGVRIEQRGLVPMLDAQREAFHLDARGRVLWLLSPLFDASVSDVGTALMAGAALCIERGEVAREPERLIEVLRARRITHVDLPPSLLSHVQPTALPVNVATVIIGGEPAPPDRVRAWARRVRLVNVYGPTEATVCTSLEVCRFEDGWRPGIGSPLPEVTYRVVADVGAQDGELWIGGPGLARDYAGEPAETALRFVSDERGRWYRTGDRVVVEGGRLLFAGRIDRQVKIGGKRVEPEEIEAVFARAGRAAAVVPVRGSGGTSMCAFVEADASMQAECADAWRSRLAAALPTWMVPSRIASIAALPRTATGKVDLGGLEERAQRDAAPAVPAGAPPVDVLAALAARILGRDTVDFDADLFEIGADSMAVLTLIAGAESHGFAVGARAVYEGRTPRAIAALAGQGLDDWRTTEELLVDLDRHSPPSFACAGATNGRVVFVTGATGFLGRRVLGALVEAGYSPRALVRARDDEHARDRVGLDGAAAFAGELSQPRFGWNEERFRAIAVDVACVLHLGAEVRIAAPYAELAPANVDGAVHAIAFARAAGARFVHGSTLSVFVASDRADTCFWEDDDASAPCALSGGYAQTKWVAEQLVRRARVDGGVIRYGLLTPDRISGRGLARDWLSHVVRELARAGMSPRAGAEDVWFDATPVDHAADATVAIVRAVLSAPARRAGSTWHVAGARFSLAQVLRALCAERVRDVDVDGDASLATFGAALGLGLARMEDEARHRRHRGLDLFAATGRAFDDEHARTLGIERPILDDGYLRRCVRAILEDRPAREAGPTP